MSTVPDNDNDTDLLYDDISEEDMKLSSIKTFVGSRNKDLLNATNRDGHSITTGIIDTTTSTVPTNNNNNTVQYDFMTLSTRTATSLNMSTNIENDTFDPEHPSLSSTTINTTATTPLLNSIELVPILQEQIRQLQQENRILKRNIGILYRTAKTEIQRKDQQLIEQQQQQLQR